MKTITVITTTTDLIKVTGRLADTGKLADTCDLIEATLDSIPQGGFTPKDIRDRNRIQIAVDKYRKAREAAKGDESFKTVIELEDADYDNMKYLANNSRWASREKSLQDFLDFFQTN
jgi:hypothetical protein